MSMTSVQSLLSIFRRTHMFDPDHIAEIEREIVPHYTDGLALARYLLQVEWLTQYQFEALIAGDINQLAIGHYTLLDRLGSGGVSEVYKAWSTVSGQIVALKVLRQHLCSEQAAVHQFEREHRVLTRLNHANVIRIFEAEQIGDLHLFAMEYVQGMDLGKYVETIGPLPLDMAAEFIRQIAQGLQHAHQYGLVHRDIKPANILLINPPLPAVPGGKLVQRGPSPIVKIADWGLARVTETPSHPTSADSINLSDNHGLLIGTVDYVSPEQARDPSIVDTRGDIYSLGCTFYYLLTGSPPFDGKTLMHKLLQHQDAPRPSVRERRPDVPEEVDEVIQKMMAKDPMDRFQIPLLVVGAVRRFGPAAASGSVIRTSGSGIRPAVSAPKTVSVRAIPKNR